MSAIDFLLVNKDCLPSYRRGFIRVYQEVFAGPPYWETYSPEQVLISAWQPHLDKGCIFLALDAHRVVGLACSIPLLNLKPGEPNGDVCDFLLRQNDLPFSWEKTCYMSELAVLQGYRGQGIGHEFIRRRFSWAKALEIDNYVMRTAAEGSLSLGLYLKLGAQQLNGEHQDVSEIGVPSASTRRVYLYGAIPE